MDNPKFQQHGGDHAAEHPSHGKRKRHNAFFWVAVVFISIAISTFVLTNGFSSMPGRHAVTPIHTLTP